MVSVCDGLEYFLILTLFLSKVIVAEEVTILDPQSNTLNEDGVPFQREFPNHTGKAVGHQTGPLMGLTNRMDSFSKSVNLQLAVKEPSGIPDSEAKIASKTTTTTPHDSWNSEKRRNAPSPAKQDVSSDSPSSSGWGFLSTFSQAFGTQQPPKRTHKPIEDIPILGGIVSLGGAIGLAGQRGATLLADGGRKLEDLARGGLTKSGYKLPKPAPASNGLAQALDGVSGLTRDELGAVVSAVSGSKGRAEFVKQLLEKSHPESAFRIGLAAASVHGLKSNPALGSALGLLEKFAN